MQQINGIDISILDAGILQQKWNAKPRPYPYDTGAVLSVTSHADTANEFGTPVKIIPKTTFDFGDVPNSIQIAGITIETMSENAVFILEFRKETTPIGALRFYRSSVQERGFDIVLRGREIYADTEDVYAVLKSTPANITVGFSILVLRHICTSLCIEESTGTFPTG